MNEANKLENITKLIMAMNPSIDTTLELIYFASRFGKQKAKMLTLKSGVDYGTLTHDGVYDLTKSKDYELGELKLLQEQFDAIARKAKEGTPQKAKSA